MTVLERTNSNLAASQSVSQSVPQTVKYGRDPVGPGIKIHCTGEGPQQFSSQLDSWRIGLGTKQSPARKAVSTEAELIVESRY